MKKKESQVARELGKFVQAFWLELPMAAANRVFGNVDDGTVQEAGWKAYDAFVSLTNEATNQIYANPLMGALTGSTMERSLRMQRVGSAMASAFFGNLWPALGLPTANEVAGLRTEVAALRSEVREALSPPVARAGDERKVIRNTNVTRIARRNDEDAAA
jgi:hypothetical protein